MNVFEDRLGYQLRRLDILMMDDLAARTGELGLTPSRATALVHIALNEGCDQTALGRALDINAATTMGMVNVLVGLGAVERRRGTDRRSNTLHLTQQGRELREAVDQLVERQDRQFFAALTSQERTTLYALLRKLRRTHSPVEIGSALSSVDTRRTR